MRPSSDSKKNRSKKTSVIKNKNSKIASDPDSFNQMLSNMEDFKIEFTAPSIFSKKLCLNSFLYALLY